MQSYEKPTIEGHGDTEEKSVHQEIGPSGDRRSAQMIRCPDDPITRSSSCLCVSVVDVAVALYLDANGVSRCVRDF